MAFAGLCLTLVSASAMARGAHAQVCAAAPVLRVAVFNANATIDTTNPDIIFSRLNAMVTALPQAAQDLNLDVICLNELRQPAMRDLALRGVVGDPSWNIYHPEAIPGFGPPGQPSSAPNSQCKNACTNSPVPGTTQPMNELVQSCALSPIPQLGNLRCVDLPGELELNQCMKIVCPLLEQQLYAYDNPGCIYCLQDGDVTESYASRVLRCAGQYNAEDANQCVLGHDGEAGATLLSRFPFEATEYRELTRPTASPQRGVVNWGVTYGKIQTPSGPVHLFCASHATTQLGMEASAAEALNATQSQEVLDYIQSKANGELSVYLASTGSGPAVVSSPTGPANAQWPANFAVLESGLTDALIANVDANSTPLPAAACTYGCGDTDAGYVDHIMTSGSQATPGGYGLCSRDGGTLFTSATVNTIDGLVTLSPHYGVYTEVSLQGMCGPEPLAGCRTAGRSLLMVRNNPASRFNDKNKRLKWVWTQGDEALPASLGDPTTDNAYAVCVYDGVGGAASPIARLDVAATAGRLTYTSPVGWKYMDGNGESAGVTSIHMRPGADGKTRVMVMAKGSNLELPDPRSSSQMFASDPSVVVQLVRRNGECWESEFTPSDAKSNKGFLYRAVNTTR